MKYNTSGTFSPSVPPTGDSLDAVAEQRPFRSWQPSTWPPPPAKVDPAFIAVLATIINESILDEIGNVIQDISKSNGDLQHRGHVVALALMCALEAISAYGYAANSNHFMAEFIANHFPENYKPYADRIYKLYRTSLVHSWNLFEATILPSNEAICESQGAVCFGLLNFFEALRTGVADFMARLESDRKLQESCLRRYRKLKKTARP